MNDFFLVSCRNEFMENARLLIFETYCRIHQTIDISTLAQKLDMDQDAAARWIVNLIRNAHLDAKIDSAANHVIMGTQNPSMYALAHPLARPCFRDGPRSVLTEPRHSYQQVIDKTKSLSFRTHVLANNLDKYVVRHVLFNLLMTPLSRLVQCTHPPKFVIITAERRRRQGSGLRSNHSGLRLASPLPTNK